MYIVLSGILFVAVLADLARAKIPNRLIIYGLVVCLLYSLIYNGPPGVFKGIINVLITFLLLYFMFLAGALGAGDIKLMCVVASLLGAKASLLILFVSGLILLACRLICFIISSIMKRPLSFGLLEEGIGGKVFVILGKGYCFKRVRFSPFILVSYIMLALWKIV